MNFFILRDIGLMQMIEQEQSKTLFRINPNKNKTLCILFSR